MRLIPLFEAEITKTVYHGTADSRFGKVTGNDSEKFTLRDGVAWFTDNRDTAASYANPSRAWDYQEAIPKVLQFKIRMSNPLEVDAQGMTWNKFEVEVDGTKFKGNRELVKYAKENGYDGLIIKNVYDNYNHFKGEASKKKYKATTYAVFSEDQILPS